MLLSRRLDNNRRILIEWVSFKDVPPDRLFQGCPLRSTGIDARPQAQDLSGPRSLPCTLLAIHPLKMTLLAIEKNLKNREDAPEITISHKVCITGPGRSLISLIQVNFQPGAKPILLGILWIIVQWTCLWSVVCIHQENMRVIFGIFVSGKHISEHCLCKGGLSTSLSLGANL